MSLVVSILRPHKCEYKNACKIELNICNLFQKKINKNESSQANFNSLIPHVIIQWEIYCDEEGGQRY